MKNRYFILLLGLFLSPLCAMEKPSSEVIQLDKQRTELSAITDESVAALYQLQFPQLIYIPKEQLIDSNNNALNLKELFEKNNLITGSNYFTGKPSTPWNNEDWSEASLVLKQRAEGEEEFPNSFRKKIHLDKLLELSKDTKSMFKSFLPIDELSYLDEQKFIEKSRAVGRLFTYAQLQRVIEQKNLSHVHLPLKILVIKDLKTGKYITGQTASKILDDLIKIFIFDTSAIEAKIHYYSEDYQLVVLAKRQAKREFNCSQATYNDLRKLISEAPFDIGYDNIFSDSNRDAIIIDTESDMGSAKNCLPKLDRYFKSS